MESFPLEINDLPSEILAAIFEAGKIGDKPIPYRTPYEIRLSHVSSHWRTVAHSTPSLWTRIHLSSLRKLHLASRYLERSRALPIRINVDIYREDKKAQKLMSSKGSMANTIMDVVTPHLDRCQTLLISAYHESTLFEFIARFVHLDAPLLERLAIKFDYWFSVRQVLGRASLERFFRGGTPRLQFLETDVINYIPPLSSLTTLHIYGIFPRPQLSYETVFNISASSPFLENFYVHGPIIMSTWPLHLAAPVLHMNALRTLLIESGQLAANLLLSVSAPRLQSLWLECSFDSFRHFYDSLQFTGQNKFPELHYLTLQQTYGQDYETVAFAFPTIQCLHLSYPGNVDHLRRLQDLFERQPDAVLQKLHTIVIRTINDSDEYTSNLFQCLRHIISSRHKIGLPIARLLTDPGAYHSLLKLSNGYLSEQLEFSMVDTQNYQDPWWISSHADTLDRS